MIGVFCSDEVTLNGLRDGDKAPKKKKKRKKKSSHDYKLGTFSSIPLTSKKGRGARDGVNDHS